MSRRHRPAPQREPIPNFPQHQHPEPFDRLMHLGSDYRERDWDVLAAELRTGDTHAAVARLLEMTHDMTYYDYSPDAKDPRNWTRWHALCVLSRMGEAARAGIEPLLVYLNEEDDLFREELPLYYAAMGEPALEPLAAVLQNPESLSERRVGAGDSLEQLGEEQPALRPRIIPIIEQVLATEEEDLELNGFLVCNLMDLGAIESLPLIEQVFEEDRVEDFIVCMADVQEHFGLPVTAPRPAPIWNRAGIWEDEEEQIETGLLEKPPASEEVAKPYVAAPKVGRNEPCPCGSGKKYKKCCGS